MSVIFVRVVANNTLIGYVMISQPYRPPPVLYKMPGGTKEPDETPVLTAQRELKGETNISINELSRFRYVDRVWLEPSEKHDGHWKVYFIVDISPEERDWMSNTNPGNEGEDPHFFSPEEFRTLLSENKIVRDYANAIRRFDLK